MPIFQLLYASGSCRPLGGQEINDILNSSRRNNARLEVTGMLLAGDDVFLQLLEGERRTVKALAERISNDRRHRNFMVLLERETPMRAFSQWEMGFKKLDPSRAEDAAVFRTTRLAIEQRVDAADGGILLDTMLAFARDLVAAA